MAEKEIRTFSLTEIRVIDGAKPVVEGHAEHALANRKTANEPDDVVIHAGVREGGQRRVRSAHSEGAVARLGHFFRGDGNPVKRGVQRQVGADVKDYPEEAFHLIVTSLEFVDLVVHAAHRRAPTNSANPDRVCSSLIWGLPSPGLHFNASVETDRV